MKADLAKDMAWMLVYLQNSLGYLASHDRDAYLECGADQLHHELNQLIEEAEGLLHADR